MQVNKKIYLDATAIGVFLMNSVEAILELNESKIISPSEMIKRELQRLNKIEKGESISQRAAIAILKDFYKRFSGWVFINFRKAKKVEGFKQLANEVIEQICNDISLVAIFN